MNRKILAVLGIVLIGLVSGVDASSSVTWVNFTVNSNNGNDVEAFNCMVDGLDVDDEGYDWISLNWENCDDAGFLHNLIFVDRILVGDSSGEFFNVTGLIEDTQYELSIISISEEGEEGVRAVVFGKTLDFDDDVEEVRKGNRKTGMGNDVIPNFFVGGDSFDNESVVYLNDYIGREEKFFDWWSFICGLMLAFVLILLLLIIILLI